MVLFARLLLISLLAACLGSFAWGMQRFFVRPSGYTLGMRVTGLCGSMFAAAHILALLWHDSPAHLLWTAAALYAVALAVYWWAISSISQRPFSAIYSSDLPTHLVQGGPYRFVRHPLYSSYLLTWTAGIVGSAQLWLLPTLLIMLVLYLRAGFAEERKFRGTPLAEAYAGYRSRTGMFFPNPIKLVLHAGPRRGVIHAAGVE